MKRVLFSILSFAIFSLVTLPSLFAEDLNDLAYRYRFLLRAGTILNSEGIGDCLLFPYYDVRRVDGSSQVTEFNIENTSEYGIAVKLRVREWSQGREVFSADIWIPSAGVWSGRIDLAGDGTNAGITSVHPVITGYDTGSFYLSQSLASGSLFSILKKKGGGPPLYGYIEVIGEERTAPAAINSVVGRLAAVERDCPNSMKGSAVIQRVEEGVSMGYEAVAVGNFSRGQGSLFRSPGSPYPLLNNGEDSLDQLEFQLSKWEMMGPYSLNPSIQEKTHLIITFPTRHFHYKKFSKRINQIDNPFKASNIKKGEILRTTVLGEDPGQEVDSTIVLPFSVNVIGLSENYPGFPAGIDNGGMSTAYESGEVTLTSDHFAQRIMIQDFEYFQERFSTYRGLPALGLLLHEYRNPDLQATITPVEFSAVWEPSQLESVLIPNPPSGPSYGQVGETYTFVTGGSGSSLGHPIEYQFDWGDGTTSPWGGPSQSTAWTAGGAYTLRARVRCSLHTGIISEWSDGFTVVIESVSTPSFLSGPGVGLPGISYTYTIGGSFSSSGHPVQYFFDWGDGTDSNWLPVGTTSASKLWLTGGEYIIRGRARCATDTIVVSDWISLTVKIEWISVPSVPVGPDKGIPGESYLYMTGGAQSSTNDPIEYQFDWGDGTFSGWQSATTAFKTWSTGEIYDVRARARCALHTSVMSDWSSPKTVNIERVTTPDRPSGPEDGIPNTTYTYTASGAVSTIGDPIQYFFEWGDGTDSGWLPVGTQTASKKWLNGGTYSVRVKARCATHTFIESDWSTELTVGIETVSPPSPPSGPALGLTETAYDYIVGGALSSLEHEVQYQFNWGDGTTSGWVDPGTGGTATASKTWSAAGVYTVRARARCKTHTSAVSGLSGELSVTISSP